MFAGLGWSDDAAAMAATTLAYLPKIPAVLLTTYLIDRIGRRALLSTFVPVMAVCLLALAAATGGMLSSATAGLVSIGAVTLYGLVFGMSLGPIPNILASELFPTDARSSGVALSTSGQVTLVPVPMPVPVPVPVPAMPCPCAAPVLLLCCSSLWLTPALTLTLTLATSSPHPTSHLTSPPSPPPSPPPSSPQWVFNALVAAAFPALTATVGTPGVLCGFAAVCGFTCGGVVKGPWLAAAHAATRRSQGFTCLLRAAVRAREEESPRCMLAEARLRRRSSASPRPPTFSGNAHSDGSSCSAASPRRAACRSSD